MKEILVLPESGTPITVRENTLTVPDAPVVCYIDGDGVGAEITTIARQVLDAAVQKAFRGKRCLAWMKLYAGKEAMARVGITNSLDALGGGDIILL